MKRFIVLLSVVGFLVAAMGCNDKKITCSDLEKIFKEEKAANLEFDKAYASKNKAAAKEQYDILEKLGKKQAKIDSLACTFDGEKTYRGEDLKKANDEYIARKKAELDELN